MKLNKKSILLIALAIFIGWFAINLDDIKAGYKAGRNASPSDKKQVPNKNGVSSQELNKRRSHFNQFFQLRNSEDLKYFSKNQLKNIEKKYQIANKDLSSKKAINTLIELTNEAEYKGANRIGCALQYLGQISDIDQQEKYLLRAKSDYSNSWYGNGVNVGAYATYKLALYYSYKNNVENAEKYKSELLEKYSDHIDHRGNYFKDIIL